jgi:CheY-like chemotaxis protein
MKAASRVSDANLVVVMDNHPLVLQATGGLLRSWGCHVVMTESYADTMARLSKFRRKPDLIVCDYHLAGDETGVEAIKKLRLTFGCDIPALLITSEVELPPQTRDIENYRLLWKPVNADQLREAMLETSELRLR